VENSAAGSAAVSLWGLQHSVPLHEYDGPRYVYSPTVSAAAARRTVLDQLLSTFFDGSTEGAMAALLEAGGLSVPVPSSSLASPCIIPTT
jgi:hypothetical protein